MFKMITLFTLLLSFHPQAKVSETTKKMIKELLHAHEGCPENSSCTKEQGAIFLGLSKAMQEGRTSLKKFNKESGFPLRVYTTLRDSTEEITYDSKCFHHRSGPKKYYQAIKFVLNTKEVNNKDRFYPRTFLNDKKSFITSTNATPLYITNDALYSYIDFNNKIYTLKSSLDGGLTFDFSKNSPSSPKTIKCSKELIDTFKAHLLKYPNFDSLYKGHYCREIFNIETKSYELFITGWEC